MQLSKILRIKFMKTVSTKYSCKCSKMVTMSHWNKTIKICNVRESNPGLPRGRREFYHWTNVACISTLFNFDKFCHYLSFHKPCLIILLNLFDDVVLSFVSSYKFSNKSHHSLALIKGSHVSLSHGTLEHTLSPWQCHVFQFLFAAHLTNFVTQHRRANEQLEQSRDVKIYQVLIMNIIHQEKLIFFH